MLVLIKKIEFEFKEYIFVKIPTKIIVNFSICSNVRNYKL